MQTTLNPMPELAPMLKQLRLSGVLDSLAARNREAIESKLSYSEFLALVIQEALRQRTGGALSKQTGQGAVSGWSISTSGVV